MAFIDVRLDECVAYGFTGGPEWSTQIVPLDNGREVRNAQWLYPRHRYTAQYMNLRPPAQRVILAAFHACRGQLHAFRFKDHNDYQLIDEPIGIAAGGTEPVQLVKSYEFGAESAVRLIQAPTDDMVVKVDGTPIDGTFDGQGRFTPADEWPSDGAITASGTFDVWVRFASDYNAFTIGSWQAHTADVELVEVRR